MGTFKAIFNSFEPMITWYLYDFLIHYILRFILFYERGRMYPCWKLAAGNVKMFLFSEKLFLFSKRPDVINENWFNSDFKRNYIAKNVRLILGVIFATDITSFFFLSYILFYKNEKFLSTGIILNFSIFALNILIGSLFSFPNLFFPIYFLFYHHFLWFIYY